MCEMTFPIETLNDATIFLPYLWAIFFLSKYEKYAI